MDYKIQLLSLFFSFFFGIIFYFTSIMNYFFIKKYKIVIKYIITFIYMIDITLLYILMLYKINNGFVHIYFLFLVLFGFLFGVKLKNMLIKNVKLRKYIDKLKQK